MGCSLTRGWLDLAACLGACRADICVPARESPDDLRTNAVESVHRSSRKIIKTRGSFPSDKAAIKLFRNTGIHWRRPVEWTAAMGRFAILFKDPFVASAR
jgi:transposase-like protein